MTNASSTPRPTLSAEDVGLFDADMNFSNEEITLLPFEPLYQPTEEDLAEMSRAFAEMEASEQGLVLAQDVNGQQPDLVSALRAIGLSADNPEALLTDSAWDAFSQTIMMAGILDHHAEFGMLSHQALVVDIDLSDGHPSAMAIPVGEMGGLDETLATSQQLADLLDSQGIESALQFAGELERGELAPPLPLEPESPNMDIDL